MNTIVPIILILASIGIFFGYTNPTYRGVTGSPDPAAKSVAELQSEEKDYVDALTKTAEIERARTALSAKFDAINQQNIEKLEKMLPDNIDSVRLIIDINNRAAKYGMSLSNITLSAPGVIPNQAGEKAKATASMPTAASAQIVVGPAGNNLYDSVKLGFSVSGPYENFLQFLNELEESLRVVDIVSLSFDAGQTGGRSAGAASQAVPGFYNYSMTIRTYYLK